MDHSNTFEVTKTTSFKSVEGLLTEQKVMIIFRVNIVSKDLTVCDTQYGNVPRTLFLGHFLRTLS